MKITRYVVVKMDVVVSPDWKKISVGEDLDIESLEEVVEHIVNECDYRFEFEGEKIGRIEDTEIIGQLDAPPMGL